MILLVIGNKEMTTSVRATYKGSSRYSKERRTTAQPVEGHEYFGEQLIIVLQHWTIMVQTKFTYVLPKKWW